MLKQKCEHTTAEVRKELDLLRQLLLLFTLCYFSGLFAEGRSRGFRQMRNSPFSFCRRGCFLDIFSCSFFLLCARHKFLLV